MKSGKLLEWAEVFGHRYGTPRQPVEKALRAGRDVLFDIDWQGTQQLREKARDDLVSVFILPPTAKELERRFERRAQDSRAIIGARMAKAAGEMSHWPEYDYVIVNRDKERSLCRSAGDTCRRAAQARAADRPVRVRARPAGEVVRTAVYGAPHLDQRDQRHPPDRRRTADAISDRYHCLLRARQRARWHRYAIDRRRGAVHRRRARASRSPNFGPIFSSALVGATLGAASFGPLADRLGRKTLLIVAAVLFGVFTILTAAATSLPMLMMFRVLAGYRTRRRDAVFHCIDLGIRAGAAARRLGDADVVGVSARRDDGRAC